MGVYLMWCGQRASETEVDVIGARPVVYTQFFERNLILLAA